MARGHCLISVMHIANIQLGMHTRQPWSIGGRGMHASCWELVGEIHAHKYWGYASSSVISLGRSTPRYDQLSSAPPGHATLLMGKKD